MLYSQNKLEILANQLLMGKEVIVDGSPDYCEGKAYSRPVEIKGSEAIDKPYKEHRDAYGVHIRSWKAEDYEAESISNNGMERYSAFYFNLNSMSYERELKEVHLNAGRSECFKHRAIASEKSEDIIAPLSWNGIYNPAPSNSVAMRGASSFKFILSDCFEMKPQWNMYLYKNDYVSACIRLDRLAAEYADREKVRLSKVNKSRVRKPLSVEQKARKAELARAKRASK